MTPMPQPDGRSWFKFIPPKEVRRRSMESKTPSIFALKRSSVAKVPTKIELYQALKTSGRLLAAGRFWAANKVEIWKEAASERRSK